MSRLDALGPEDTQVSYLIADTWGSNVRKHKCWPHQGTAQTRPFFECLRLLDTSVSHFPRILLILLTAQGQPRANIEATVFACTSRHSVTLTERCKMTSN